MDNFFSNTRPGKEVTYGEATFKLPILYLRVARKGIYVTDTKPLTTFSVKDNKLIKTILPQRGMKRISLNTKGSFVNLGSHPMAQSVIDLEISSKPFMAAYYSERSAILPSGEVIEDNVRSLDGYSGKDREAKHTAEYTGQGV